MHELLEKVTRIPQVRGCAVIDVTGNGTLVSWMRDGGDPIPLEGVAFEVFEVMSELLPDNADSPAISLTFDTGARLLARRYGAHFAVVICDANADLVTVRVALQGLALKISLHQRALSLSDAPPRSSRPSFSDAAPKSVPSRAPSDPAKAARTSAPASSELRRSDRAQTPPAPGDSRTSSQRAPGSDRAVNSFKMREDLVRLFAGQLGPLATLLVDEQIQEQGGLPDQGSVVAVFDTLLGHVRNEDTKKKMRAELDKLLGAPGASIRPPSMAPPDTAPYRSMPAPVDDRLVGSLAQLFIEFVGPIGRFVFDEEVATARTGPLLLKPQARTLLTSLAKHVPQSTRKSFMERAERLIG